MYAGCRCRPTPRLSLKVRLGFLNPMPDNQFVYEALQSQTVVVPRFQMLGSPATQVIGHLLRDRLQLQIAGLHFSLGPKVPICRAAVLPEDEFPKGAHCPLAVNVQEANDLITEVSFH